MCGTDNCVGEGYGSRMDCCIRGNRDNVLIIIQKLTKKFDSVMRC